MYISADIPWTIAIWAMAIYAITIYAIMKCVVFIYALPYRR